MNILEEANSVLTDRSSEKAKEYGPFSESIEKTARIASELSNSEVTPELVFKVLIALKLSRMAYSNKRDTMLDMVAYIGAFESYVNQPDDQSKKCYTKSELTEYWTQRVEDINKEPLELTKEQKDALVKQAETIEADLAAERKRIWDEEQERVRNIKASMFDLENLPDGYVIEDKSTLELLTNNQPKNLDHLKPEDFEDKPVDNEEVKPSKPFDPDNDLPF